MTEAEATVRIDAPMQGTIVAVHVAAGDSVEMHQPLLVIESMKMEHVIASEHYGVVERVAVEPGATVQAGDLLVAILEREAAPVVAAATTAGVDVEGIRPDLAEVVERHALGYDEQRPDAVERRRRTGQRTTRENVDDLVDPGSFVEYGPMVIAAQRRRRELDDLIRRTPADGLVGGIGTVNGHRTIVMSYDYTVLAGTQGLQNHRKKDRLFELAERLRLPVVFFTEGGGGRPGDTDGSGVSGLDCMAFALWGSLSGLVPLVGINSGRCFAGNAALLGCCDVVIATANSNIGMGGPAMIEGGGLGVYEPEDVGPMSVQVPNGVVDIAVDDEAEAVAAAKRYLSFFQGPVEFWTCPDQRALRHVIPENRLRVYDVRAVVDGLADDDSVLELRPQFGIGMVTSLIRVEGRPMGLIANNPTHLAGAIDADGADKAARFMQLCDAYDLPILFLCDTPGIMVGPEVEKTALVRHVSRMFVTGGSLTVPFFTIILRKGYGLGAQTMAGGSFKSPIFTVSWPTGEFGGMGLEGAVRLGYRKELEAIADPAERDAAFEEMVARMYEHGKALNTATYFEIDDVIDPADSRRWITSALDAAPPPPRPRRKEASQHRHVVATQPECWVEMGAIAPVSTQHSGSGEEVDDRLRERRVDHCRQVVAFDDLHTRSGNRGGERLRRADESVVPSDEHEGRNPDLADRCALPDDPGLLNGPERVAISPGAVGERSERASSRIADRRGVVGEQAVGDIAPQPIACCQTLADATEHQPARTRLHRHEPRRYGRPHRVADDVDRLDPEMVEQRERVARHGVRLVRRRITRLVGLSMTAGIRRDHVVSRVHECVDDTGRDPVEVMIGGEPVQQQHVGAVARAGSDVGDPGSVEGREPFHQELATSCSR